MQRGQNRRIDFSRTLPETSGMVMDKIKRFALACAPANKLNDAIFMLVAPPLVIVRPPAGIASREQLAAHARSRGSGDGRTVCAAAGHFTIQRPQDLFRAAR